MLGSCPECHESIRVPEGRESDLVRCPLCSAEYELGQVLKSLPPQLEIVGKTNSALGIDVDSSDDSELKLAKAESVESGTAPSRRYQPRKRKQVNAFAEILKVILGGLVAIPIGVLCVWWFAGRAPFGIAETVGRYAPWIVPEKLRSGDRIDESEQKPENKTSNPGNSKENQVKSFRQNPGRELNASPPVSKGVLGFDQTIEDQKPDPKKQIQDPEPKKNEKRNE